MKEQIEKKMDAALEKAQYTWKDIVVFTLDEDLGIKNLIQDMVDDGLIEGLDENDVYVAGDIIEDRVRAAIGLSLK